MFTEIRQSIAQAARQLAAHGLVAGSAGNVSAAVGDLIAITATGAELASLTPAQVTVVDRQGAIVDGDLAPTSELHLHLAAYHGPAVGAVVHSHSPMATTLSVLIDELPVIHYEQLLLGGAVKVAPFAVFGSRALAEGVQEALAGRHAAILANHGAVATGPDLAQALRNAMLLEWVSGLYYRALAVGTPRCLGPKEQEAVISQAMRLQYGSQRAAE